MIHFDVYTLTDEQLSSLIEQTKKEAERRVQKAVGDAGAMVKGHEYAKRAIVVAAAGNHSMVFWGGPYGKTLLRALAFDLGVKESWELHPCPCGYLNDAAVACKCSGKGIKRWRAGWQEIKADIWVEVCRVPEQEMKAKLPGTPFKTMKQQIEQAAKDKPDELTLEAQKLLSLAVAELGLSPRARKTAISVAATIASLENSKCIETEHIAEAVSYRKPTR